MVKNMLKLEKNHGMFSIYHIYQLVIRISLAPHDSLLQAPSQVYGQNWMDRHIPLDGC